MTSAEPPADLPATVNEAAAAAVETAVTAAINAEVPSAVAAAVNAAVAPAVTAAVDAAIHPAIAAAIIEAISPAVRAAINTAMPMAVAAAIDAAMPLAVTAAIGASVPRAVATAYLSESLPLKNEIYTRSNRAAFNSGPGSRPLDALYPLDGWPFPGPSPGSFPRTTAEFEKWGAVGPSRAENNAAIDRLLSFYGLWDQLTGAPFPARSVLVEGAPGDVEMRRKHELLRRVITGLIVIPNRG